MSASKSDALTAALHKNWSAEPGEKPGRYIGKFFGTTRLGDQISGKVEGNHGTYTVTIKLNDQILTSACSCYIGKHGSCHHCAALAYTFQQNPAQFSIIETKSIEDVHALSDLAAYLRGVSLAELLGQMKQRGITQKAFCDAVGMSSRHLSAVRSSEQRNHFYHELGAIKLAILWVMENLPEKP